MNQTATLISTLVVLLIAAAAHAGVRLNARATVAPGPVTLADIATLEGDDAQSLATVEIEPDAVAVAAAGAQRRFEIRLAQVRAALDRHGVNWGRIALSGASCLVRIAGDPPAPDDADTKDEPERAPEIVALDGPQTVRTRVAALLATLFDAEQRDLRLLFDERDDDFLATPEWGRRIDLQPNSTGSSSRQSVTVRIFEGERLVEARTIRIDALVRREILLLAADVNRDDTIRSEHLVPETVWFDPAEEAPVHGLENAVGMHARTRLEAGDILRVGDIEPPLLVRRVKARAEHDARMGELVECRIDGRRSGFAARVTGEGIAVVNLDLRHSESPR
jgi:hypothetical protein